MKIMFVYPQKFTSFQECNQYEYLWLDRQDDTFEALVYLPWINEEDQFMFFLTTHYMMPKSRIAIKHLSDTLDVEQVKTEVTGFRVLVSENSTQVAMHAVLLTEQLK